MSRNKDLITYIMQHRRCSQDEAEAWANMHFGQDWRSRKPAKTKRIKLTPSNEKEWPNE